MKLDQETKVFYPSLYDLCDRYKHDVADVDCIINYILAATEIAKDALRTHVVTYDMVFKALEDDLIKYNIKNKIDPALVLNACQVLVESDDEIVRKIAIDLR